MKIDVSGGVKHENLVEYNGKFSELEVPSGDFPFHDGIRLVCRVKRDGDISHIVGTVYGVADLECSRCLTSLSQEISGDFDLVVKRLKLGEKVPEIFSEDEDDTDNIIFISHDQIFVDVTGFVRDALLLSVPYKPLCGNDCKGLCPDCGADLNEGPCGCVPKTGDPRWGSLTGLLKPKE